MNLNISVITINVNRLNSGIKRQRLSGKIGEKKSYVLQKRNSKLRQDTQKV